MVPKLRTCRRLLRLYLKWCLFFRGGLWRAWLLSGAGNLESSRSGLAFFFFLSLVTGSFFTLRACVEILRLMCFYSLLFLRAFFSN